MSETDAQGMTCLRTTAWCKNTNERARCAAPALLQMLRILLRSFCIALRSSWRTFLASAAEVASASAAAAFASASALALDSAPACAARLASSFALFRASLHKHVPGGFDAVAKQRRRVPCSASCQSP